MFGIAICDDEPHFREQMKVMLMQYMQDNGVYYEIDNFQSGKELLELGIEMNQYKIIFLDINMDEMDGITTAKKIREKEYDRQLAVLDKAYEEAAQSVARGYAKQLKMLTGDIVLKPQTGVSYSTRGICPLQVNFFKFPLVRNVSK